MERAEALDARALIPTGHQQRHAAAAGACGGSARRLE
jgi:hypothetical protein